MEQKSTDKTLSTSVIQSKPWNFLEIGEQFEFTKAEAFHVGIRHIRVKASYINRKFNWYLRVHVWKDNSKGIEPGTVTVWRAPEPRQPNQKPEKKIRGTSPVLIKLNELHEQEFKARSDYERNEIKIKIRKLLESVHPDSELQTKFKAARSTFITNAQAARYFGQTDAEWSDMPFDEQLKKRIQAGTEIKRNALNG